MQAHNVTSILHHGIIIPYHSLCRPALENLGFYHIVSMKEINIDKFLTQQQIDWHTRALVLEVLSSIIFPDTSGDSVPAMYLQFIENLEQPTKYNCGLQFLCYIDN